MGLESLYKPTAVGIVTSPKADRIPPAAASKRAGELRASDFEQEHLSTAIPISVDFWIAPGTA